MEPLDTRTLLTVTFKFTIVDPSDTYKSLHPKFQALLDAAGHEWSTHLVGNATLEYDVAFSSTAPPSQFNGLSVVNRLAQGGAKSSQLVGNDPSTLRDIYQLGTITEIKSGIDPNGTRADAGIAIFGPNIGLWYFDPQLNRRTDPIPEGQIDGYSVLLQEIAHTLGFASTRDPFGNLPSIEYTFDQDVFGLGFLSFAGTNAVAVYRQSVPLAAGDPNFLGTGRFVDTGIVDQLQFINGNFTGFEDDLSPDLMGGIMQPGERKTISRLDLAILKDTGLPVTLTTGAPQGLYTIDGTGLPDNIDVNLTNGTLLVRVNNSVTSLTPIQSQQISAIVINGLNGQDVITISGSGPAVAINGGSGNDSIYGGPKGDSIFGGGGNDLIVGRGGGDLIRGGDGKDSIYGNGGSDRLFGEAGTDALNGGEQNDRVFGGGSADTIVGATGDDFLSGDTGNDVLSGAGGKDRMDGGAGADSFYGGAGANDSVDYSKAASAVTATIDGSPDDGAAAEGDNLFDVEVIIGSSFNDVLVGDEAANFLIGGAGNDTLAGAGGNDTLEGNNGTDVLDGGGGVDSLLGGAGNDTLVGGNSVDAIFGEADDDAIFTQDNAAVDTVDGGDGIDSVTGDTVDLLSNIESQDLIGPPLPLP